MFNFRKKDKVTVKPEEDSIFEMPTSSSISEKVKKRKEFEGQLEVLKKEQKLEIEKILKEYEERKQYTITKIDQQIKTIETNINDLNTKISALKSQQSSELKLIAEELKIAVENKTNKYDQDIMNKGNEIKRLDRIINAEAESINDLVNPSLPNSPTTQTRVKLFEDIGIESVDKEVSTVTTSKGKSNGKTK